MKTNFYARINIKQIFGCLAVLLTIGTTVNAQIPTAFVTTDTTCQGSPITLTIDNANGSIQWQSNIGAGWVNETNPGFDSSVYVVMPVQDIDYRAYVVGATTDTTNVLNIHVVIVAPPVNTTTDSVRCGIGPVDLSASGSGQLLWYETPTSTEFVNQGNTYTPFITATTTYYVANTDSAGGAGLGSSVVITEVNLDSPSDMLEIQNVSAAPVDISGWSLAISDSYTNINLVNTVVQTLTGTMLPGALLAWTDAGGGGTPWGINMFWAGGNFPGFAGWAILLDDNGDIVDFVPWNWPATNIQAMNTTIAGFNIIIDQEWIGAGINSSAIPNGSSMHRQGNSDNNDLTDFIIAVDNTLQTNPGLIMPFPGGVCESPRIPVTAYSTSPPAVIPTTSPLAVCQTDTVTIDLSSANPNYIYTWSPTTFLDTIAGPNVIAVPTSSITYILLATDTIADCVTSDTFFVDVGIIPSAGTANAPVDTVCVGATTAISVTSSIGNIQWQINSGGGWVNAPGAGSDSTVYVFMPSINADYRAVAFSGGCPNDTSNTVSIDVLSITDPTPFDTIRCGPGPVNMRASGIGEKVWYDSPIGGIKLGSGSPFTINIQNSDTFYVESNVGTLCNVGEFDNTIGNTSTFTSTTQNWGLIFNASQPIYLDRVHVYVGNTGGFITVNLRDAVAGNLIQSGTFPVPANVAKFPLDLGWFVPNGTGFALELEANLTVDLIYNFTGSGYPISTPGCPVVITGYFNPNPNAFDDYLYFYAWEISDGCKTNRFPAIATVLPLPPKPSITQNANTLSAVDPALAYQWYLNGIPIAGATSQSYVVTALGDYQVAVFGANGCSDISNNYTITIISPPGFEESAEAIHLQVYPNPVTDAVYVSFELDKTSNVTITICNALGKNVIVLDENKVRGVFEQKIDLSTYSDGIYLLQIEMDDISFNRKLIVAR